jgi:glycosyltransferase involved in cell wall biosynthesis
MSLLRSLVARLDRRAAALTRKRPDELPAPPAIRLVGHLTAATGVGEVARNALQALRSTGAEVCWRDIEPHPTLHDVDAPATSVDLPHAAVNLLHTNAADTRRAYRLLGRRFFDGRTNIGHWSWEMPRFPSRWHGAFALYDEIWVDSRYTQSALGAVSPIPVVQMPSAVAPAPPAALPRAHFGLPDDRFVFLFMCDACSILERKNPRALIRAFRHAFGTPRPGGPLLVLKLNNLDLARRKPQLYALSEHDIETLVAELDAVGGMLIDRRLDRAENSALMDACDAYISLHRCEGFGMTMAEAMFFGKPCIATAYSGNVDFMSPLNSYLVGYELVELERSWGPYEAGDVWAEADAEHAAAQMKQVFSHRDEAAARGRRAATDIRRTNGLATVGHAMQRRLQHVVLHRRESRRLF